jgi:hypothetical protein
VNWEINCDFLLRLEDLSSEFVSALFQVVKLLIKKSPLLNILSVVSSNIFLKAVKESWIFFFKSALSFKFLIVKTNDSEFLTF